MANRAEVLQEKLNILRRIYTMELPSKVDELERHLTLLREGGKDQECLAVLHRLTHNMVGSGSTFGFPVVSQKAGQLYSLLLSLAEGPLPPSEEQFRRITSCLADLRDVAAQDVSA